MPSVREELLGPPQRPPARSGRLVIACLATATAAIIGTSAVHQATESMGQDHQAQTEWPDRVAPEMSFETAMRMLADEGAAEEERRNGLIRVLLFVEQAAAVTRSTADHNQALSDEAIEVGRRIRRAFAWAR